MRRLMAIALVAALFPGCRRRPAQEPWETPPAPAPTPAKAPTAPPKKPGPDGEPSTEGEEPSPTAKPKAGAKVDSKTKAAIIMLNDKFSKAQAASKAFFGDNKNKAKYQAAEKMMESLYEEALKLQESNENNEELGDLCTEISASLGDLKNARPD